MINYKAPYILFFAGEMREEMKNQLHQDLKHRYVLNLEQRTIIHKYFDDELVERIKQSGKKKNKVSKGKWVSKSTIPAALSNQYCKCGGQVYVPEGLPEIFDSWGICAKCGAQK